MARLFRCLLCQGAALAALIVLAGARSNAEIRLDVTTGFDNNYRIGSWTPLQVRLSGLSADTNAHVQVVVRTQSGTQVYGRTVRLRAGVINGPVTLYYYHPDLVQPKDITVAASADGRTLVEKSLDQVGNALSIPDSQPAIIGLTQDQSGLNFLSQLNLNYVHVGSQRDQYQVYNNGYPNGLNRPSYNRVIYPKAADLPDSPNGYEALDVAVLGDLPLDVVNEDQWNALVGWVRSGGILVVSGSADLNRLRSKQLAEILPIEATGVKQVADLPGLGYQYGSSPRLRSTPVVTTQLKPDALALCRQGDMPLVVERRVGSGLVIFTAFDLLAPEFRTWQGQGGLWSEILQRGGGTVRVAEGIRLATEPVYTSNRFNYGGSQNRTLTDALAGVQSTEAPSFTTIGIFLLCYIVMLVPVNYLVLKRWDRKELAWLTIPAIIFVFSAGAYAVGYRIKGGQLYLHYCSVIEGAANSDGWEAYSIGSIFSPRQARYDLSIADPGAMVMEVTEGGGPSQRGMADLVVERDQKTTVKSALVNMWDHRQFDFQTFLTLGGQVAASVQPIAGNAARVQISNGTRLALSDCSISYGTSQVLVGTLAPGESKSVKVSLANAGNNGTIQVIGGASPNSPKAVNDIRNALAGLAGSASMATLPLAQGGNSVTPQPGAVQRRTPFVMTGWFSEPVVGLSLEGESPIMSGANLLVVHLPTPEGQEGAPSPASTRPPAARVDPFSNRGMGVPGIIAPGNGPFGGTPRFPGRAPIVSPIPEPANTHNNSAYQYAARGDLQSAMKEAELALNAAPTNGMVLDTVGEMHQRRREYSQAVTFYRKALKYLPQGQRTETEQKFGETLLSLGKRAEAVHHLQIAAQDLNDPHGALARQSLARIGARQASSNQTQSSGPIIHLSPGQIVPQIPTSGKGSRRILQPLAGGGSYYIVQRWDYTSGQNAASQSTTFMAPGQQPPQ